MGGTDGRTGIRSRHISVRRGHLCICFFLFTWRGGHLGESFTRWLSGLTSCSLRVLLMVDWLGFILGLWKNGSGHAVKLPLSSPLSLFRFPLFRAGISWITFLVDLRGDSCMYIARLGAVMTG